jgi:glycosidase
MKKFYCFISFLFLIHGVWASAIILHAKNATVWLPQQTITGSVVDLNTKSIIVHFNDSSFFVPVDAQQNFNIILLLKKKVNKIWAEAGGKQNHVTSDTINYTLGYQPVPLVQPFATVKGNVVFLHADIKSNPYNLPLSLNWSSDKRNPAQVKILHQHDSAVKLILPITKGDYYFNLTVTAGNDKIKYQTFVTRSDSIHCFNLKTDHATWIDGAVIYEITPDVFTEHANYDSIAARLPELSVLGINTIWLQPVYKTHRGHQGYDVTDYFSLRDDLGTEQQLQHLISKAKSLRMKVLFDFVANHTSNSHPYFIDCILHKSDSHYYNFYQQKNDGAKYSSLYKTDTFGFYHYFWKDLVNVNYDNEEVQRWIIEACKYWLQKFDLDGYRFDAAWAFNARDTLFGKRLQSELKSIKPDILLLAEDKGERKKVYEEGFDAAYDWKIDTNWISHWSWQYNYDPPNNPTIFNFPDEEKRGEKLLHALFDGDTTHLRLRFMENNDQPRFILHHGLARTKMVAALMFALPGIPMIYDGQEIGCTYKVYSAKPIFKPGESIQSQDKDSLFSYYQQLIQLRTQYKSLRSSHIQNLRVNAAGSVVALHRWMDDEQFIVVINMSENSLPVIIDVSNIKQNKNDTLFFTNVLLNETFRSTGKNLKLAMPPYTTKLLLVK